jgi:hypothetical protein
MTEAAIARRGVQTGGARNGIELATAPHRERGLWTFLTWSFFLSQIIAAQHFVGSAAAATGADEQMRSAADVADHSAVDLQEPLEPAAMIANESELTAPVGSDGEVAMPPVLDDQMTLGLSLEPIGHSLLTPDGEAANGHPAAFGAFVSSFGDSAADASPPDAADAAGNGTSPLLDDILAALPDTIDGVGGILSSDLDSLLDNLTGTLQGTLGGVLQAVDSTVGQTTDTVAATVDGVLDLASTALDGVAVSAASTLDSVLQLASTSLEGVTASLDAVTQGLALPIGASAIAVVADPALEKASSLTVSATEGLKDIVVDGASIVLKQVADITGADDLFANGRYTPYNLALQDGDPSGQGALSQSILTPIEHALADSVHLDFITGDSRPVSIALPSALEEIGLRGLGDSLS